jgi:hypothetical protein
VTRAQNKARRVRSMANVQHQHEALAAVERPGDIVTVVRDIPRTFVMRCPDGCGEVIILNLDRRAGPAWRLYKDKSGMTVYPSVWRDTGCESHFIVWADRIYWLDDEEPWPRSSVADEVTQELLQKLNKQTFVSVTDLADSIPEMPWTLMTECRRLAAIGILEEGTGSLRGYFRLR